MEQTTRTESKPHCLRRISYAISEGLEVAFFYVGHFVGEYPILTIILSLVICGLCGTGLKTFSETTSQEKLWVPQSSRLINEKAWVDQAFPDNTRFVSVILESERSVLTPPFLSAMMDYYSRSVGISVSGLKFGDFCFKVGSQCRVSSLLELWDYNTTAIRGLSRSEIISTMNHVSVSPSFGYEISTLLGGKGKRSTGRIMSASATQMTWVTTGHEAVVKEWEREMINIARTGHPHITATFVYASRSFDDEGYGAVDRDITLLTAGFSIVFVFVMLSLGKFNLLEQKIYVSLAGMMCVGLSLLFAYGLATAMDLIYSPIQSIMPFLLLGIGVDDMFVVVEAWKNLSPEETELSVPKKIATALKKAGVSITVTSITDAVAFGVGASTVIPALSAFCVYAVLGIFALYVLVATFFSACLCLDERRRRRNLDACVLCYRHKDYTPSACSKGSSLLQVFFSRFYGPFLMKLPVKVGVIVITMVVFAVNVWSFTLLKQEFKLATYIPSDSYAYQFFSSKERLFDTEGVDVSVYCGNFSYLSYRSQLEAMYLDISTNKFIQNGTVTAWFMNYHTWLNLTGVNVTTEQQYINNLQTFLTSVGPSLGHFVSFDDEDNPSAIIGSYITLRHTRQPNSASDIDAMESLRAIVDGSGLPLYGDREGLPQHKCFAYSPEYMTYETNKVLLEELYRNLALAGVSVLLVTCVLIANLWTSILVFLCVIFTVVDVAGVLQFSGTSVDTASSILLTLTVGLAVDYSAHIGHTFMTISGPRTERTVATLRNMGPAVFNGGFSTFLAFVLLAKSASYGFVVFFRVFSTVVLFGLFHGLALLPVLLSVVGPPAYLHADLLAKSHQLSVRENTKRDNSTSIEVTAVDGTPGSDRACNAEPLIQE
ncbi:patched domain-containing protein 3-like isoform X2 [Babylonia areolata]|uniref:patched domain-containing protein 3-like isoform X2 n=1 Tax=Babylonia areolata TaxID=304850 RepID=UPI003FD5CAFF